MAIEFNQIIVSAVLALVAVGAKYARSYILSKIKQNDDSRLDEYMRAVSNVVMNTVEAAMQTSVLEYKASGKFDKALGESIKSRVIMDCKAQLPDRVMKALENEGINLGTLLSIQVEKAVLEYKCPTE